MRILIAYDGSEGAEAALDDLKRAGLPQEAEALIMVTDVWMVASQCDFTRAVARRRQLSAETSSFAPALRSLEEERALTREATRRLRAAFPSWDVGAEGAHGAGAVAPALLRRAAAWGADLLVVGSRRPSAQNLLDGGATRRVAAEAPCAVRVARPAAATPRRALRILVGGDGPSESGGALRAVASRAWPPGSECRVVSSAPPGAAVVETLKAAGLTVSTALREGDERRALIEEASSWGADCIFVGANAREARDDLNAHDCLITSLVAGSPCSVEVARSPTRAAAGAFLSLAPAPLLATAAGTF